VGGWGGDRVPSTARVFVFCFPDAVRLLIPMFCLLLSIPQAGGLYV
jgi:hypothetical protein